jgi:hypothetical protein
MNDLARRDLKIGLKNGGLATTRTSEFFMSLPSLLPQFLASKRGVNTLGATHAFLRRSRECLCSSIMDANRPWRGTSASANNRVSLNQVPTGKNDLSSRFTSPLMHSQVRPKARF